MKPLQLIKEWDVPAGLIILANAGMKPLQLIDDWHVPAGLIILADARLINLEEKRLELQGEYESIVAAADDAGRDLTQDELDELDKLRTDIAGTVRQIEARKVVVDASKPAQPRRAKPEANGAAKPAATLPGLPGAQRVPAQAKPANEAGTHGFMSFGEFAKVVGNSYKGDESSSARIANVTSTYGNEGVGADGGFLVPPDFRTELWTKVTGEDSLFARVQQFITSGNGITFPADETTPWDTTNGVQAYWGGEGDTKTPSKPSVEMKQMRLNKLYCLVPVSDELLEDAPGLESWLRVKAPTKMQARLNTSLVRGNGVGKPLGFLNAGSLVTVSKQLSQDAASIVFQNITDMWSRLWAPSRANAVWIINQDVEGQLMTMRFPTEDGSAANSPYPVYLPAGGLSASPYATLMGRPVVPVEAASSLGTIGDISLVDWSQYMGLTKGGGIKTDVSMHLYFDQDLTAFRFVLRINGQPLWGSTIVPENGSMTRSWAVTLETRA